MPFKVFSYFEKKLLLKLLLLLLSRQIESIAFSSYSIDVLSKKLKNINKCLDKEVFAARDTYVFANSDS